MRSYLKCIQNTDRIILNYNCFILFPHPFMQHPSMLTIVCCRIGMCNLFVFYGLIIDNYFYHIIYNIITLFSLHYSHLGSVCCSE
jgi:hypothetical protein